jgi:hypothetical protein
MPDRCTVYSWTSVGRNDGGTDGPAGDDFPATIVQVGIPRILPLRYSAPTTVSGTGSSYGRETGNCAKKLLMAARESVAPGEESADGGVPVDVDRLSGVLAINSKHCSLV